MGEKLRFALVSQLRATFLLIYRWYITQWLEADKKFPRIMGRENFHNKIRAIYLIQVYYMGLSSVFV